MTKIYPWKQALVTGIISAAFATSFFSLFDGLKEHYNWQIGAASLRGLIGLLSLVILGIGIYTGMNAVKRGNKGALSYGQALLTGLILALTVGIVMAVLGFIYSQYINPGYAAYMLAEGKKELIAEGKSPAEILKGVASLQKQLTAAGQAAQCLVGQTAAGLVLSLIMALFLKNKTT